MDKTDIAIATITWARNIEEEKLLRESLPHLDAIGVPVFMTDGGSDVGFLDFLNNFPNFNLVRTAGRGVWAQAKSSIAAAHASGSRFILYTEPDKLDFFRNALPDFISGAPTDDRVGVVLASRSVDGYSTFPEFQRMTEATINKCCAEIIGKQVDYTYGPFLFTRELVPYLNLVHEDIGWGWRPYTFGIAHRLGYRVEALIRDFCCPPDQREDNKQERIYRMRQLSQNIQGLVLSTTIQPDKSF